LLDGTASAMAANTSSIEYVMMVIVASMSWRYCWGKAARRCVVERQTSSLWSSSSSDVRCQILAHKIRELTYSPVLTVTVICHVSILHGREQNDFRGIENDWIYDSKTHFGINNVCQSMVRIQCIL
jgi:hypothetical protein